MGGNRGVGGAPHAGLVRGAGLSNAVRLLAGLASCTATFGEGSDEVQRCDGVWGGQGGLDSVGVAELVRSAPVGKQLCFEVREDVDVLQQLSVPAGVSLELRGRGGADAPAVSAAGVREGRAITVALGARLVLRGLVLADAPHGAVGSTGGDVRIISCSFERNGGVAAVVTLDQPAVQWSTAYAGSVLGLTLAARMKGGSGGSNLGVQAAAGAAGMLLLPASVMAPCSDGCGSTGATRCCYSSTYFDSTNGTKSNRDFHGGAIEVLDANLEVVDSSFKQNSAHKGGAIYWSNSHDTTKSFELLDSVFRSNQARDDVVANLNGYAGSGGAVYVKGSADDTNADPVFLRNVNFTSNVAFSHNQRPARREFVYGGALSIVNTNVLAHRCSFIQNGVAESLRDQHAYGGAVAAQATVPGFRLTLDECSFERNDAMHGHAIFSTECGTDALCGTTRSGGVTLAVVRCNFARNGQGGVMTGQGFQPYAGELFTIVSDSPVQYVQSTGLAVDEINIDSAAAGGVLAKTVSCRSATSTQAAACPELYFGPTRTWREDHEVVNIFNLANVGTNPGAPGGSPNLAFTADPDALQCADCSADEPSDCNGFELGVRCTTWEENSDGEKVAVCAPNGYGTSCRFCGFSSEQIPIDGSAPARTHSCGITGTGTAAGNCTDKRTTFECTCNAGWMYNQTSQQCDIDVDECWSGPCQNSGICVDSSEDVRVAPDEYRCDCIAGWGGPAEPAFVGLNCEDDVDECASTPCLHQSFCVESRLLMDGRTRPQPSNCLPEKSSCMVDPPLELQYPQAACSVQQNWPPASWPPDEHGRQPEPEPEAASPEDVGLDTSSKIAYASAIYTACQADIETLVNQDWPSGMEPPPQDLRQALEGVFMHPSSETTLVGDQPFNLIAIWCMIKAGDMHLWPWWCDERRMGMGACPGVRFTYIDVENERRRIAIPSITENRSLFAPFLIEQLGQQAYDLGTPAGTALHPTSKLTQTLQRLECRALGGCCPAFNNTDFATSYPYVDPVSGESNWEPTDSRSTTDCHKAYRDQCKIQNGGVTPDLVPDSGLYVDCPESNCMGVESGTCVHSDGDRSAKWSVAAIDYFDMVQAEEEWAQGQLYKNCHSGFDFGTHRNPAGRQYFRAENNICRPCSSLVPVGAFECWCAPGWGWDNAPELPRDVYTTSTGNPVVPDPPIASRVGVDNCDHQQDNCWDPELEEQPCLHGGTCVNMVDDYRCECTGKWLLGDGWTGKQCDACIGMLNLFCEDRILTLVACIGICGICAVIAHKKPRQG